MKLVPSRSFVSTIVAGAVAVTWCVAGVAASPSSPWSATTPKSSGGPDRSIIIVGGHGVSMRPLNPQPLPPRR